MELQHHGILGMHWGVRRFQKKDGSLTPKGVTRYADKPKDTKKAISDKSMDGKSLADHVSKNVSEEDYTSMNKAITKYMDTEMELDDALHGYGDVKAATSKRDAAEKILRNEISKQSKKYMDIDFDPNGNFSNARDRDAIERFVVNMEGNYDELKHSDILIYHGVKGMHWGVRRYRNSDGTLTAAGKKRVSKQYKKLSVGVQRRLNDQFMDLHMKAYNKAADKMNSGLIDKFNSDWDKTRKWDYGKDYDTEYQKLWSKVYSKAQSETLSEFYDNDRGFQKAKSLVKEYGMTSWDDLARDNAKVIDELRKATK